MRRILSEADLREFRDRVCAVATELLAELGYDGFNMRELAARLGVSAMTTYRYFDGKNEIFAALRVQAFNRLADRLECLLDPFDSALERLEAFCHAYVDFAHAEPVRYRLMFDVSQPQVGRPAELINAERRTFQAVLDLAALFARSGQPESNPERLAQILWASLHGLAALSVMEAFRESELDSLVRDAVRRFAGPDDHRAVFQHKRASGVERQPHGADRTNGAQTPGWTPLTAAE